MRKVLLYCICLLWAVLILANILRLFGSSAFVSTLSEVPDIPVFAQKMVKALMFYVEMAAGLLLITRGSTKKVYVAALVATLLSGFVSTPMENLYMNAAVFLVVIVLYTNDPRDALQEFIILLAAFIVYGYLTQLGRFFVSDANYKSYAVQVLSCIDYKALPVLSYLYVKYYRKEDRICFCLVGTRLGALFSSAMKLLRRTTSSTADSSK